MGGSGTGLGNLSGTGAGSATSSGSRGGGINVFGEDDEHSDPMAQTAISSSPAISDLNLEGVGSGSGLLDLTRESDDTSLGAELIDELTPGRSGTARPLAPPDTGAMSGISESPTLEAPRGPINRGGMGVTYVEAADPMASAFGGLALGTAFVLLFGIFALVAAVYGTRPDSVEFLHHKNLFVIAGICAIVPIIFFVFGLLIGKSRAR